MTRGLLVLAAWVAAVGSNVAWAAPARYAVVVGQNRGDPDEETLRYAERDATRVADVLTRLGDVDPARMALVLAPTRDRLLATVDAVTGRIGAEGQGAMLVVYYSGHADGRAIHLDGSQVRIDELEARLRSSHVDVKLLIIDACRSGSSRSKGGRPAAPFTIRASDQVSGQGVAVITSAAANEDAQESDQLQGSFFTHHLVTGMLGAADRSSDRQVSLAEAYEYAYAETLRATSAAPTTQHPTYSFQLTGRKEVILTRLDSSSGSVGMLTFDRVGEYLIFAGAATGALVAELTIDRATQLALPAGRYAIRQRGEHGVFDGVVQVQSGRVAMLDISAMKEVPRGMVVRKGYSTRERHALSLGTAATTRRFPDGGHGYGLSLVSSLELSAATLDARVSLLRDTTNTDPQTGDGTAFALGGYLGVTRSLDVGAFAFGVGGRLGLEYIATDTPPGLSPRAGVIGRAEWAPAARWRVFIEGGLYGRVSRPYSPSLDKLVLSFVDDVSVGLLLYP